MNHPRFFAFARLDYLGVRIGRFYFTVRNVQKHRPLFSERNRIRCCYLTLGRVRGKVSW